MSVSTTSAPSTGLEVAILDPGERLALAGLDEIGVDDGARVTVNNDLEAVLDVVHSMRGHGELLLREDKLPIQSS